MLQEEVQKMKAEQAAMARRQKSLMKNKLKDDIKQNSGKITSFFQRKQITVVAAAQPTEEFEKEASSKRTIARKCNQQMELLFQQTPCYQTQLAVLEKMNKTLLGKIVVSTKPQIQPGSMH